MTLAERIPDRDVSRDSWFESLLGEVAARFMQVADDQIDGLIEDTQRHLCTNLGIDRSTLWQRSPQDAGVLELTHMYQPGDRPGLREAPELEFLDNPEWVRRETGVPPIYARMKGAAFFPWILRQINQGQTVVISSLLDLPPDAALDREMLMRFGTRSNVVVPLALGGRWFGCISFGSVTQEQRWSPEVVRRLELIAHLFAHALGRKAAMRELRENDARLAAIFDSSAEGIVTFSAQGIIESANAGVRRIFGYRAEELVGKHIRFLMPAQASEEPGESLIAPAAEIRLSGQRKDGSIFPIEVAVSEIKFVERPLFTGFIRDITRSKQAEEALRESEQRFRTIADSAPVLIWMADVAKECIFVNRPWLIFTGRTAEQVSGAGWIEAIAAEDRQLFLERFHEAVDTRQPFVVQFRLRRRDGAYRWLITSGVPSFDCAGQFSGYIGSCTDITEQKEAQRAAQELSGLLIRAQEDHRARLARELHDDITQRLARFAIDIGRFTQRVSLGEADEDLIRGVADGLAGLSRDVHLLSYELHPSALIDLGLEAALSSECEQFSRRELMVVELKMRQLPAAIPRETAVGLFRIVQEGLRNAVRHGRASRAEVSLLGVEDGLQLVVHDNGIGFDTAQRRTTPSLGIASMRERTRLLGGEFDLESEPGRGTTIIAWAPL